ncbi:MAG: GTPase domain-containing protein [Chloroflexia bacterium]|nr:GTPase domain-containing protein [Chloroflexia bacterium]MDQ3412528.1 GTPase domain-containing protein [Chloroflexota bacterium]
MALVDLAGRQIRGKIVYYGPAYGGKTTNLEYIYRTVPAAATGELHAIAAENERTLFFDYFPLDLGTVNGFTIRYQLYTVPGQAHYERTRQAVLSGADGVVFVADSAAERLVDNEQSLDELRQHLLGQGKTLATMPFVVQYNKRDQPTALPTAELDQRLNPGAAMTVEAIAVSGAGVFETLRAICKLVTRSL